MKIDNNPRSRSEQLRTRRVTRTQTRASQVTQFHAGVAVARPQPGITARRGSYTPVTKPRKTANPGLQQGVRRKYYTTAGANGVEMSLPTLPSIHFGWRLLSGIMVLLLAAALFAAFNLPTFRVDAPKLTGFKRITPADIQAILNVNGSSIVMVDPTDLQTKLTKAFPELADISVTVTLPNKVSISARERKPILAWEYGGQTVWIDQEGAIFPPRGEVKGLLNVTSEGKPPYVPLPEVAAPLAAADPQAAVDPKQAAQAAVQAAAQALLPRSLRPDILKAVLALSKTIPDGNKIVFSRAYGLGWIDSRGVQVFFGSRPDDNLSIKMVEYTKIVEKLEASGIKPSLISVENIDAPFFRSE